MKQDFKKWIGDIKNLVEKRVGKIVSNVWIDDLQPNVFEVGITFFEGQMFWMSFNQIEFNLNNKKQCRTLAKIRRQDLAQEIENFGKILIKTANKLK